MTAGSQSRSCSRDGAWMRVGRRCHGAHCDLVLRGECLLDLVGAGGVERLAHLGDELEEPRLLARLGRPRLRQVDRDDRRDPPGPRRHDDDARGQEHGLGDRVGDEDHRRAGLRPDAQQLEVEPLARHLVERAERLVHQQERRRERERARDRDALLHAARELPGVVLLEPGELDELDHLLDARRALRAVPAQHLERQRDVLRDRAPVVEDGRLEDDPVVAVEPRLAGRLAVDRDVARRRLDDVADDAQQRRLPAARRSDQRDELATLDLEVDALERRDTALAEDLRDAADRRRPSRQRSHQLLRRHGARRASRRGATTRKKAIPSSAAMRFVAQRFSGSST